MFQHIQKHCSPSTTPQNPYAFDYETMASWSQTRPWHGIERKQRSLAKLFQWQHDSILDPSDLVTYSKTSFIIRHPDHLPHYICYHHPHLTNHFLYFYHLLSKSGAVDHRGDLQQIHHPRTLLEPKSGCQTMLEKLRRDLRLKVRNEEKHKKHAKPIKKLARFLTFLGFFG